jgi:hypothetical protein
MIPPRAKQILERLYEMFPQIVFEWENKAWPFMDESPCSLSVCLKTDPEKRATLDFSSGIAGHTVEDHVQGIVDHLIPRLK